jgi:hypothetical protein
MSLDEAQTMVRRERTDKSLYLRFGAIVQLFESLPAHSRERQECMFAMIWTDSAFY